jgi:enoyl-CoA hydratase/carnithine racemase
MADRAQTTIDDGVAHVRLSRPEKRNGLDLAMFHALLEAGETLAGDKTVRAVVLSGEGPGFCAGLDFAWFMSAGPEAWRALDERQGNGGANAAQRVTLIWQEVPVPVIAAVHGFAFGGGLQLALGADLRYVTADAKLSVMEIKWGLIPDMGLTQTLLRLVPLDVAKELTFTGRLVSGSEAAARGLATRVCADPLEEALATARELAGKSPHALRAGKRLLNEAPALCRAEALALETELQVGLLMSPNQLEAVQANMMKRPARFVDPE